MIHSCKIFECVALKCLVMIVSWSRVVLMLGSWCWVVVWGWGCDVFLDGDGWLHDFGDDWLDNLLCVDWLALYLSLESVVVIGGVVNGSLVAVSVDQGIVSWDSSVLGGFVLFLNISGVVVWIKKVNLKRKLFWYIDFNLPWTPYSKS